MSERGGRSRDLGEGWRAQARQMFHWWHRVRDSSLSHARFASSRRPMRREVARWLEAGQTCGRPKTEGTCRAMRKWRRKRSAM
jgi:transposase